MTTDRAFYRERSPERSVPIGILTAAQRHRTTVLAPLLLFVVGAVFFGQRHPAYVATSQLTVVLVNPGWEGADSEQAAASIARGAQLILGYRPVLDRIADEAGMSPVQVEERLGTAVPPGGGLEIRARGDRAATAARLANAASGVLVSYLQKHARTDGSADRLLRQYVAASFFYRRRASRADRLERRLGRHASSAEVTRFTKAVGAREIAGARRDALRRQYQIAAQAGNGNSSRLEVAARADGARSDQTSRLLRLLIVAAGAGLLVGLCLATLQANHLRRHNSGTRPVTVALRRWSSAEKRLALGVAAVLGVVIAYAVIRAGYGSVVFSRAGVLIGAGGLAYLLWRASPWISISAGIALTPFSGNWALLGLPGGYVAPDRILLIGGVLVALLRGPRLRNRPAIEWSSTHALLLAVSLYAISSALIAGTLFHQEQLLELVEAFGFLPFLVFVVAPWVFRTEARRQALLVCLVALGGYLGLTALFEALHLDPLVWPRYINDPSVGIHLGRARGPFLEAVTNGTGLFATGTAAAVALRLWQGRFSRMLAACVVLLCLLGLLFTLQRSVWLAAVVSMLVVSLAMRELRPFIIPAALAGTLLVIGAFAVVPDLRDQAEHRAAQQETIWDRDNLNRAATNMVAARPLFGFGWGTFEARSREYFRQGSYPLSAIGSGVHNIYLGYASSLGLIGVVLWALGVITAIVAALSATGPPELRFWRFGFLCYATFFLVVSSFVPPQVFPNLMLWTWAGLVWSGRVSQASGPEPRDFGMSGPDPDGADGSPDGAARSREPVFA